MAYEGMLECSEKTSTTPEVDDIDGFKFVAFERLHDMDWYVRQTKQGEGPYGGPHSHVGITGAGKAKQKAGPAGRRCRRRKKYGPFKKTHSASSSTLNQRKRQKGGSVSKPKKSLLWKHKKRLRSNDKRVIVDKMHGFMFVSAFALEDFDKFEQEIAAEVHGRTVGTAKTGMKRKSTLSSPTLAPKKARKKMLLNLSSAQCRRESNRKDLESKNRTLGENFGEDSARNTGVIYSKHGGNTYQKDAGKNKEVSPLINSNVDHLKRLKMLVMDCNNQSKCIQDGTVSHDQHLRSTDPCQSASVVKVSSDRTRKRKQFLKSCNEPVIYSSELDGSVTVISDAEGSTYLDVCSIDDSSSSAQFIRNRIEEVRESEAKKAGNNLAQKSRPNPSCSDLKNKQKRKCKMCCLRPCRIFGARKVEPLWQSCFPSYQVWFTSSCKLHPPGQIEVGPSSSKKDFVDACIQTTAADIKMHQDFAQRFPHPVIAIKSNDPRVPGIGCLKPPSMSKSEFHRTSEQIRRDAMRNSFLELHRVITVSQADDEGERTSKQWILENAQKLIASLKDEEVLLSATKKNLEAKNERLRKRWKELSGKDFDPSEGTSTSENSGLTKLISLYKKYQEDVQKESSSKSDYSDVVVAVRSKQKYQDKVADIAHREPCDNLSLDDKCMKNTSEVDMILQSGLSQSVNTSIPNVDHTTVGECGDVDGSMSNPSLGTLVDKPVVPDSETKKKKAVSVNTINQQNSVLHGQDWNQVQTNRKPSEGGAPAMFGHGTIPSSVSNPLISSNYQTRVPLSQPDSAPSNSISVSQSSMTTILSSSQENPGKKAQPQVTRTPDCGLGRLKQNQSPMVKVPVSGHSLALKLPQSFKIVGELIPVKNLQQAMPVSSSGPQKSSCNIPADGEQQPNFTSSGKPTQWTTVGKISSPAINSSTVQDAGAVVKAGDTIGKQSDGKLFFLDVAKGEKCTASTCPEQTRTISLIQTSSCINVTLNSVGSITSNKIFNMEPMLTKSPIATPKIIDKKQGSTQDPSADEVNMSVVQIQPTVPVASALSEVPVISENLLKETIQSGNTAPESDSEPGLCVISNVFSLSHSKVQESVNHNKSVTGASIFCTLQNQAETKSPNCNSDGKESGCQVDVCNSMAHDHNYSTRYNFPLPDTN